MSSDSDGEKPSIMTENEVMARLAHILDDLAEAPHAAVEKYQKKIAPQFSMTWPTPRASDVHALLVEAVMKLFPGRVIRARQRWLFRPTDDLSVQMKKLGRKGLPLNYQTKTAIRFAAQLPLRGVPEGMRVTLGYVLSKNTGAVSEVRIVGQYRDQMLFSRELQRPTNVVALPAAKKTAAKKGVHLRAKSALTNSKKKTGGDKGGGET